MANKEERIEISTYDLNNMDENGDIPIDILKVYTRQEAIEVIAKRLIFEGVNYFECNAIAKWCLDALLEGVIKKKDNAVYELYTYNNGEKVTIGYAENMTDEKELEIKYK